ncbi:VPLPA-CTERM sorting domain-containing protein [Maridesulfovibrio sp.]|uniref:VPLPA-CTERM sorting domain-containing protein n=1 Tax=unclassified Maridesulfovibrio TaxID=2794999 RepID=UPI003AFFE6AA
MKRIYTILALLVILAVPAQASASYFYTLEGTVGSISDGGGLARASGISIGDTVRYVIEVDTDRLGYRTIGNGKTKTVNKSYYTSLFSGNLNGYSSNSNSYLKDGNYNYHAYSGNDNSAVYMNGWGYSFEGLAVGDTVQQIYEAAYNSESNWTYSQINAINLKVTNISNVAPTPIPGAALLMLGGLGVVGFVRRKLS